VKKKAKNLDTIWLERPDHCEHFLLFGSRFKALLPFPEGNYWMAFAQPGY
jgi:hypothetical protein